MKKRVTKTSPQKVDRTSATITLKSSYTHKDGTCPVILRVRINGKKKEFSLDLNVRPYEWDTENRKFTNDLSKRIGKQQARDYQILADMKLGFANQIFLDYRLKKEPITVDAFAFEFNNPYDKEDFIEYMYQQIRARYKKREITDETMRMHLNTHSYFKELFGKLRFAELCYDRISDFERFLSYTKSLHQGTVWRQMKELKTYVNLAVSSGLQTDNPFEIYVLKKPQWQSKTFLNKDELKTLFDLYRERTLAPHLQRELFNFLFSCLTGLRHSDLQRSAQWNVTDGILIFNEYKNRRFGKQMQIPLNTMAQTLLNSKEFENIETVSNQKTNAALKKIANVAGINKKITSHVARHTFATMFLRLGGRVEVLQKLLGHSKIETTMQYVHILKEDMQEGVNVFNKLEL